MPTSDAEMNESSDTRGVDEVHTDGLGGAQAHETEAARIGRTEHGAYIVAPDSADPWPSDIWDRVDLEVTKEELDRIAEAEMPLNRDERETLVAASGFVFSADDRALLAKIDRVTLDALND